MDFFGSIGGVSRVLLQICGIFYGGYARFESGYETNAQLYRVKTNKDIFNKCDGCKGNIQKMNLSATTRFGLWMHTSVFAPLIKCCQTDKQK